MTETTQFPAFLWTMALPVPHTGLWMTAMLVHLTVVWKMALSLSPVSFWTLAVPLPHTILWPFGTPGLQTALWMLIMPGPLGTSWRTHFHWIHVILEQKGMTSPVAVLWTLDTTWFCIVLWRASMPEPLHSLDVRHSCVFGHSGGCSSTWSLPFFRCLYVLACLLHVILLCRKFGLGHRHCLPLAFLAPKTPYSAWGMHISIEQGRTIPFLHHLSLLCLMSPCIPLAILAARA